MAMLALAVQTDSEATLVSQTPSATAHPTARPVSSRLEVRTAGGILAPVQPRRLAIAFSIRRCRVSGFFAPSIASTCSRLRLWDNAS